MNTNSKGKTFTLNTNGENLYTKQTKNQGGIIMKCTNCGNELDQNAKFCSNCGAKVEQEAVVPEATEETPVIDEQNTSVSEDSNSAEGANVTEAQTAADGAEQTTKNAPATKKTILIGAIAAAAVVVIALVTFFAIASPRPISDEKAKGLIDTVVTSLSENDYDAAQATLEKIRLKDDSEHKDIFAELEDIVAAKPTVTNVDVSDYPNVTVEFKVDEQKIAYSKDETSIVDEYDSDLMVSDFAKDGKTYTITYAETEDEGGIDVDRKITFNRYKQVDFAVDFSFVSEYVTDATIELVTSNVEKYPEISLYLKVVDEYGNPIENLSQKQFIIREYLNIDDYLERDVIYAAKVDGQDALNVSLAIDRSSSISNIDMSKIKNATNTFISKLQFASGDKAEIISFDTNVMQMCLFTNNRDNLINGVNSMYPYGMTACYDAIARSIQNASVQSGARCVIVFTDGYDNESVNTPDSVIRLANQKSVPVYTIGVGSSVDEGALRSIANRTGGTYHHIDDISSMSQIYDEIYREQKNMYHVKYVSDTSISQDAERRIIVRVSGRGYRGYCDRTYTPVIPVAAVKHDSRYEVIKKDISWEDANAECITKGGHLATITSKDEEDKIIAVAEKSGIERLWIGGYTTNNQYGEAVGHWVMGEPFVYQNWFSENEPSRFDSDNAEEFYLMLWKIDGRWSWNDQRNDLINSPFAKTYQGRMGYVIEYEY